jgi:hypothetical protein
MAYAINTNTSTLTEFQKYCNSDIEVAYKLQEKQPNAIAFHIGGMNSEEMIRVDRDGFYVRGVQVPADDQEAETVYNAFKQWLAWANLQQQR